MNVGVLGAGQLGQMIALAGYPLGLRCSFYDPTPDAPAGQVAPQTVASYDDEAALAKFAEGLDVITYEFENVPVAAARFLERLVPVYPPSHALEVAQDRLAEKKLFRELNIPTPKFAVVNSRSDLRVGLLYTGLPAILKTRHGGYDGKGQVAIHTPEDADAAWGELGGVPLILEQRVNFSRELSVLAVRGAGGQSLFYPLAENWHQAGILRRSVAPATGFSVDLKIEAEVFARRLMKTLNYVGVLAIELFEVNGEPLANEIAPRVHNSGHWTIEGAVTSQFENHLRAICGLPLGSCANVDYSAMLNLIGGVPDVTALLSVADAHLHLYGKEARPARKLGHVTVLASKPDVLHERLAQVQLLVDGAAEG